MLLSLVPLLIPIGLTAVAWFFVTFVTWTLTGLHKSDWLRLDCEQQFIDATGPLGLKPGNYMFPAPPDGNPNDPEYQARWKTGPRGVMTLFDDVNMGRNLGLCLAYNLVVSLCLGYLATLAMPPGAEFLRVFRFITTAAFMTLVSGIVPHSIWFKCRIVGHFVESVVMGVLAGLIFAALWPAA